MLVFSLDSILIWNFADPRREESDRVIEQMLIAVSPENIAGLEAEAESGPH